MLYREMQPCGADRAVVACYWMLQGPAGAVQRIVPDGRPEIILHLEEPNDAWRNGVWVRQPRFFVAGQITGPMRVRPTGYTSTFGIRLHPHTATTLLRTPAPTLTDSITELGDLAPSLLRDLEPLADLPGFAAQTRFAAGVVARHVQPGSAAVANAVSMLDRRESNVSAAASAVNLSPRQFERTFLRHVGLSPKYFARIRRFQRVVDQVNTHGAAWVDAAVAAGYYDQAHLVRDCKTFSGETPTLLLHAGSELARHFLDPVSRFSKTRAAHVD